MATNLDIGSFFPGEKVDSGDLVRQLLRLEPAALETLCRTEHPQSGAVMAGLNTFMRHTIDEAAGRLWTAEGLEFQLVQDELMAKESGWPDLRTLHLSTLLSWALLLEVRISRELPYAPLVLASRKKAKTPRPCGEVRADDSACTSAAIALTLFFPSPGVLMEMPVVKHRQRVSISALAHDLLGFSPKHLMRPFHSSKKAADAAFAKDPEGQTAAGLAALMKAVIRSFQQVGAGDNVQIELAQKAEGRVSPRLANLTNLLAAGTVAEGGREVSFKKTTLLFFESDLAA